MTSGSFFTTIAEAKQFMAEMWNQDLSKVSVDQASRLFFLAGFGIAFLEERAVGDALPPTNALVRTAPDTESA